MVNRYEENIHYWEIGNEMNSLQFWNKVRKDASSEVNIYAAMFSSAYQIIKANDPCNTVILGRLINDGYFYQSYSTLSFL